MSKRKRMTRACTAKRTQAETNPLDEPDDSSETDEAVLEKLKGLQAALASDGACWPTLHVLSSTDLLFYYLFAFGINRERLKDLTPEQLQRIAKIYNFEQLFRPEEERQLLSPPVQRLVDIFQQRLSSTSHASVDDSHDDYLSEHASSSDESSYELLKVILLKENQIYEARANKRAKKKEAFVPTRKQAAIHAKRVSSVSLSSSLTFSVAAGDMYTIPCVNLAASVSGWQGDLELIKRITEEGLESILNRHMIMEQLILATTALLEEKEEKVQDAIIRGKAAMMECFRDHFKFLSECDVVSHRAKIYFNTFPYRQFKNAYSGLVHNDHTESASAPFLNLLLAIGSESEPEIFAYSRAQVHLPRPPNECFKQSLTNRPTNMLRADGVFGFEAELLPAEICQFAPEVSNVYFPVGVVEEVGHESEKDHPKLGLELTWLLYHMKNWMTANNIAEETIWEYPMLGLRVFEKYKVELYVAVLTGLGEEVSAATVATTTTITTTTSTTTTTTTTTTSTSSTSRSIVAFSRLNDAWDIRRPDGAAAVVMSVSQFADIYMPRWLDLIQKFKIIPEGYGVSPLAEEDDEGEEGGGDKQEGEEGEENESKGKGTEGKGAEGDKEEGEGDTAEEEKGEEDGDIEQKDSRDDVGQRIGSSGPADEVRGGATGGGDDRGGGNRCQGREKKEAGSGEEGTGHRRRNDRSDSSIRAAPRKAIRKVVWNWEEPMGSYEHSRGDLPQLKVRILKGREKNEGDGDARDLVAKILQPCGIRMEDGDLQYYYQVAAVECMENELRITQKVQGHPNIIPLLRSQRRAYVDHNYSAYVMIFPFIEASFPRNLKELVIYLEDFFKAVQHVHRLGIVHCDIKAENFLWDATLKKGYLIDFGLAHDDDTPLLLKDARKGTPGYIPEQPENQARPERDMYAAGMMIIGLILAQPRFGRCVALEELCQLLINVDHPGKKALRTPEEALGHPFFSSHNSMPTDPMEL